MIFIQTVVFTNCLSDQRKSDGYIYVYNIKGRNLTQATENAKLQILFIGLGEMIEGDDGMTSNEKLQKLGSHFLEEFILEYKQIAIERFLDNSVQISARGRLNIALIYKLTCDNCR
jgi:hypothetical protein